MFSLLIQTFILLFSYQINP